jgi:lauroyl/myristoyl acyltransferase
VSVRANGPILGSLLLHAMRALEALLPIWCLRIVLWPPAALKAMWELGWSEPTLRLFRRMPASIRTPAAERRWLWRLWLARTRLNVTKFMAFWPDRLGKPRWRAQCRFSGADQLESLSRCERPVVLAVLHLGPLLLLRYYLRSRGLAVAGLVGRPLAERSPIRQHLDGLCDKAYALSGVANVFDLTQLRDLHRHLQPGRFVIVALDGGHGNHVFVDNGDSSFRMASGAVRLAARTGAVAVPCLIRADRALGVCIHFGKPVPEELLADPRNHLAACQHLYQEFLPFLRAHPHEASYELSCRFRLDAASPATAVTPSVPLRVSGKHSKRQ